MTSPRTPRDPDRLIDLFLAEGQNDLPDPVYDAVRTEIERAPRPSGIGRWWASGINRFVAAGLAAAAVVLVIVLIGIQDGGSPLPGGGPVATPTPQPAIGTSASVTDGDFRLTITTPRTTWRADEAIEVEATLEYLGSEAEVTLRGSGAGLIGFAVEEQSGDRHMGPAFTADCVTHLISPADPITTPFEKSGGYSPEEPDAAFWEAYFADPLFHLPPGEWEVTAGATFDAGPDCTAYPTEMEVTIVLTVEPPVETEPPAAPSTPPSTTPEATPEPSLPIRY